MNKILLIAALEEIASREGHELNGRDHLMVRHRGDPVLAWAIGNVVMESDANIKPNKKKSSNKIDPAVSALMAFGTFQAEHEDFAFDMSDSHKSRLRNFNGI